MGKMARVSLREITEKVEKIFVREGVDAKTAQTVAEVLADTQAKGIVTHGFVRVPLYVTCLRSGGVKPTGDIEIISDAPTMATVSGRGGLGIAIAKASMELAISKAEQYGVGIVAVRGSHHLGATGYYADMCAKRGMIGMSMSSGNPMIAAPGSCKPSIGNNPFSYAVPAGKHGSVLYDIAMSGGSDMKIIAMKKTGERVPDGWMIDKNGRPTNDPNEYGNGAVLIPFGGYKGYGLAMMVELLCAISGANTLRGIKAWNKEPSEEGGNVGHFFMALDISKMTDRDEYISRVEGILDELAESKLAEGADKIYYPGEKEKISLAACQKSGTVEVNDDTLAAIDNLLNE